MARKPHKVQRLLSPWQYECLRHPVCEAQDEAGEGLGAHQPGFVGQKKESKFGSGESQEVLDTGMAQSWLHVLPLLLL